jgi:hypothetical protein
LGRLMFFREWDEGASFIRLFRRLDHIRAPMPFCKLSATMPVTQKRTILKPEARLRGRT